MLPDSTKILPVKPPAIVALDLKTIARQIADEHEACSAAARQSLQHAMQCGDLLLQAKRECKHGEFTKWLADNLPGSKRTAQLYMRLAKNRQAIEAKTQGIAFLSIDEAVKLLAETKKPDGFEGWPYLDWLSDLDGTGYAAVDSDNNIIELLPADHRGFYYLGYSDPNEHYWNHFRKPMPIQLVHYWIEGYCQHFDKSTKWIEIDSPIVLFDDEGGAE